MTVTKGNIVTSNYNGKHGIVLAITKDGKRAKVYVYGPDREVWVPLTRFTVETAGLERCYKCVGSGLYFMGGMILNGVYTGQTGECYACQGKGKQTDADRIRCHYYWHRKVEEGAEVESPLDPAPQQPLPVQEAVSKPDKPVIRSKSKKKNHPDPERKALGKPRKPPTAQAPLKDGKAVELIDCKGCGTLHRDDVMCPW